MRYLRPLIVVFSILMSSLVVYSAPQRFDFEKRNNPKDIPQKLMDTWSYHPGDNPEWADPNFDDSDWEIIKTTLFEDPENLPESGFDGLGWFRLKMEVDSSMVGDLISIDLRMAGAAELFLNGEMVYSWGKISEEPDSSKLLVSFNMFPKVFRLKNTTEQVIAVRFYNPIYKDFFSKDGIVGFEIHAAKPLEFQRYIFWFSSSQFGMYTYMNGFAVAIGLLHLLLFLFFPKEKSNLFYSLLITGLVLIMYGTHPYYIETPLELFLRKLVFFKLGLIITSVFSAIFIYSTFRDKLPRLAYYLLGFGVIAALTTPFLSAYTYYIFALMVFPFTLVELIIAWIRKRKGIFIVIDGTFLAFFFFTYQMLADMNVFPRFITFLPMYQEYLAGVFVLILTNSVFLAYRVGHTNRELGEKLVEVQELSEKSLRQEREAQEEKLRFKSLEMENAQKDLRLREAQKREELLEKLEDTNQELELMNQELVQTQSQLVQSEKMASLGMLTAGVAHEINTPIGAINSVQGTLQKASENLMKILQDELGEKYNTNEQLQKNIEALLSVNKVMKTGGERVTKIVKRMKSFARLDEADLKKTDIHVGLDDTLLMINHELKSGIEVVQEYGEVPMFPCHPSQLNQVFLNLMMNGVQAMGGKGKLGIRTWVEDGKAYIAISDTGIGMSDEVKTKIFDPGFTTKGVGVGTGLGLAICYNIIKDHKGEILVETEEGKGSTFTVVVPLKHE